MTQQTNLPLRDPRYKRPTMTVDAAKGVLDCSEDDIVALIDQGALTAWNIALHPETSRRELRILSTSIADCAQDNPGRSPCYHSMLPPDTAVAQLLPPAPAAGIIVPVSTRHIQRTLNCGSTHVLNLIAAGALTAAPGSVIRRGPAGFASVTRASFEAFLRNRLIN